jgi:hypothetical protein
MYWICSKNRRSQTISGDQRRSNSNFAAQIALRLTSSFHHLYHYHNHNYNHLHVHQHQHQQLYNNHIRHLTTTRPPLQSRPPCTVLRSNMCSQFTITATPTAVSHMFTIHHHRHSHRRLSAQLLFRVYIHRRARGMARTCTLQEGSLLMMDSALPHAHATVRVRHQQVTNKQTNKHRLRWPPLSNLTCGHNQIINTKCSLNCVHSRHCNCKCTAGYAACAQ